MRSKVTQETSSVGVMELSDPGPVGVLDPSFPLVPSPPSGGGRASRLCPGPRSVGGSRERGARVWTWWWGTLRTRTPRSGAPCGRVSTSEVTQDAGVDPGCAKGCGHGGAGSEKGLRFHLRRGGHAARGCPPTLGRGPRDPLCVPDSVLV